MGWKGEEEKGGGGGGGGGGDRERGAHGGSRSIHGGDNLCRKNNKSISITLKVGAENSAACVSSITSASAAAKDDAAITSGGSKSDRSPGRNSQQSAHYKMYCRKRMQK